MRQQKEHEMQSIMICHGTLPLVSLLRRIAKALTFKNYTIDSPIFVKLIKHHYISVFR